MRLPLPFQIGLCLYFFLYFFFYELKRCWIDRLGNRSTFCLFHQVVLPYFPLDFGYLGPLLSVEVHNFSQILQKALLVSLVWLIFLQMHALINFFA